MQPYMGMAEKYLLRVLRIDRDLAATRMIAGAGEGAIDPDFLARASRVENCAAFGGSFGERCAGL